MSALCNKRQPGGVWRCGREKGHEDKHYVRVGHGIHSRVITWPNDRDKPKSSLSRSGLKKGKGLRAKSDKQKRRRNKPFLDGVRSMLFCIDCGRDDGTLHFDHRDPADKKFTIGSSSGSMGTVALEIMKCDERCPSCHQRRHIRDDPEWVVRAGRKGGQAFARTTHCKYGHELTPENTRIDERGYKRCRTCQRGHVRRHTSKLKSQSQKQKVRTAFLQGIKAERIRSMVEGPGLAQCQECGAPIEYDDADPTEVDFIEWATSHLDAHHVKPRSSGQGYRSPSDHGVDSPTNIKLLCRSCHEATEPDPEFGRTG